MKSQYVSIVMYIAGAMFILVPLGMMYWHLKDDWFREHTDRTISRTFAASMAIGSISFGILMILVGRFG